MSWANRLYRWCYILVLHPAYHTAYSSFLENAVAYAILHNGAYWFQIRVPNRVSFLIMAKKAGGRGNKIRCVPRDPH